MTRLFQIDHPFVRSHYRDQNNFKVEYDESGDKEVCAIYFSSHNIYYPNTIEAFTESILNADKYEWYKTRVKVASKHIFLRDIQKQWYIDGISEKYDSIDALVDLLRDLTHGYKTIWIGSSAGGYAATLFGNILHGERIFSFNGQMEIGSLIKDSSPSVDPLVFKYVNDRKKGIFFSLRSYIVNPKNTYYFCSLNSAWDAKQYAHIKDLDTQVLRFSCRRHGIPFLKSSLMNVIQLDGYDLAPYTKRVNNQLVFSILVSGYISTIKGIVDVGVTSLKRFIMNNMRVRL